MAYDPTISRQDLLAKFSRLRSICDSCSSRVRALYVLADKLLADLNICGSGTTLEHTFDYLMRAEKEVDSSFTSLYGPVYELLQLVNDLHGSHQIYTGANPVWRPEFRLGRPITCFGFVFTSPAAVGVITAVAEDGTTPVDVGLNHVFAHDDKLAIEGAAAANLPLVHQGVEWTVDTLTGSEITLTADFTGSLSGTFDASALIYLSNKAYTP